MLEIFGGSRFEFCGLVVCNLAMQLCTMSMAVGAYCCETGVCLHLGSSSQFCNSGVGVRILRRLEIAINILRGILAELQYLKFSREMTGIGNSTHENLVGKQMLAGAIAGGLADGIMYPMMTVKSRLQVQGGSRGATAALYMYRGPVQAIQSIVAKEGWRTFYKGYATVAQVAPAQALYMATYQAIKRYLPGGHDNPVIQFGGGILASLVQSTLTVPVEVIRQRQMVQTVGAGSYTGSLHTAKTIYQHEGISAFYRGFFLNQMVWVPFNAVYLPLWETSKRMCARLSGVDAVEKLDVQYELGSAFFCSAFAAALTNPMDVIKTRLQVQGKSNVYCSTEYSGGWDAAKTIYKQEGLAGLTRGMTSRMLWVAPSAMIMFTTYDQLMKRLVHYE